MYVHHRLTAHHAASYGVEHRAPANAWQALRRCTMSRHHPDLVLCRKQAGKTVGRLCERCEDKCVICDSLVSPRTRVRICDECNYGSFHGKCIVCGGDGVADAFYCHECTIQEKDRDGCPKVLNVGTAKIDLVFERKKYKR